MTSFEGFGPKVHTWFTGLEADNSKAYFTANRDFFKEKIRDQMEALLTELSQKFGGEVRLFRQNRDIRFSADKSPYKTNTYGILHGSEIAAEGLLQFVTKTWRAAAPVTAWLAEHVGASTLPRDRGRRPGRAR